VTEKVTTRF